ncbi:MULTISPECIES: hypothetical protein [unclassified Imperialibacter]|uniref:hypothetical protein n=1 Tax=unclassified Imperialibacter TaxID=2629706 RepID=UPI00186994AD|nr:MULTISPECIES: hypothetical protein [unclassified Imperialibacter]
MIKLADVADNPSELQLPYRRAPIHGRFVLATFSIGQSSMSLFEKVESKEKPTN